MRRHLVASAVLFVAMLALFVTASIGGRWNAFGAMLWGLAAVAIGLVWLSHLGWLLLRRKRGWRYYTVSFAVLAACAVVAYLLAGATSHAGRIVRAREVRSALAAGLHDDCVRLMDEWPLKSKAARIFRGEPEYADLPETIRRFDPAYVTYVESFPKIPQIGMCTNGFGGFAQGLRVFRDDETAQRYAREAGGRYERIAPGVYVWWHST